MGAPFLLILELTVMNYVVIIKRKRLSLLNGQEAQPLVTTNLLSIYGFAFLDISNQWNIAIRGLSLSTVFTSFPHSVA